jgi:hypothetical protein
MPAPSGDSKPKPSPGAPTQAETPKKTPSAVSSEPPSVPIDQIIQRFAAREAEFKTERDNSRTHKLLFFKRSMKAAVWMVNTG